MKREISSLVSSALHKLAAFLKTRSDDVLGKRFFVDLRDTFPFEYNLACRVYNTSRVGTIVSNCKIVLNNSAKNNQGDNAENQYSVVSSAIENAYSNINFGTVRNVVGEMDSRERKRNRNDLLLLIKGLIFLQVISGMMESTSSSDENRGFSESMETESTFEEQIQDLLTESGLFYEDVQERDTEIGAILSEASVDSETFRDIQKYYESDFLEDDSLYDVDNEDEDEIVNSNQNPFDASRIDRFLSALFRREIDMLHLVYNRVLDNPGNFVVDFRLIALLLIVLAMHVSNKF